MPATRATTEDRNVVSEVTSASQRVSSSPGVRSRWNDRSAWSTWLDPGTDAAALSPLLVPAPDDVVAFHEVSTAVNSTRHNDATLVEPAPPETLF